MDEKPMKKRVRLRTAAVVLAVASAAYAAERVCRAPLAEVRSGKRSVSEVVATVKEGDKLDVIEEDKRGWLKVKVNGTEGYVFKSALDAPKARGVLASSDPRASATELAAAGKGLTEQTLQYASTKNLSTAGIEKMLETRRGVSESAFNAFVAEGRLKSMASGARGGGVETVALAGDGSDQSSKDRR